MSLLDLESILTGEISDPEYLVKGIFYQGQITIIAGEPGVGKSFLSYTLAIAIAGKRKFLELETAHGPVLYFDEENGHADLRQYLRWAWNGLGQPNINLIKENLHVAHFALVKQGANRYKYMAELATTLKPLLIIVDTATPACQIEDENNNAEASKAIRFLRLVKESAGPQCSMIILKHAKFTHDDTEQRTIRGAKTWLGELDGVIYHVGVKGPPKKDGLRDSTLMPGKVRAFGLRHNLKIIPRWSTGELLDKAKGLILQIK